VPVKKVVRTVSDIRNSRYAVLRNIVTLDGASFVPIEADRDDAQQLKTVLLPPGAWSVGRTLDEVRARGADVTFASIRRHGIVGREPDGDTELRDGDIVAIQGSPGACEHAESVLLAG
jgi:CPA2 family monovalent cation:H+ antiporter-2